MGVNPVDTHPRTTVFSTLKCVRKSMSITSGLQSEGVEVAIQVALKDLPFCHRRPAEEG